MSSSRKQVPSEVLVQKGWLAMIIIILFSEGTEWQSIVCSLSTEPLENAASTTKGRQWR